MPVCLFLVVYCLNWPPVVEARAVRMASVQATSLAQVPVALATVLAVSLTL